MFQQQHNHQNRQLSRSIALTTTVMITALSLYSGADPAAARQDAGSAAARVGHIGECFLVRLGTQYQRCDDNTGNGVPAPAWVPER